MSDISPAINWISAVTGCLFTLAVARFVTRPTSTLGYLGIGFLAFGIGIAFFFFGSLLHGLCVQPLQMCKTHGDANLSYIVGGLLAFPAYWLILSLCSRFEWDSKTAKNQYMAASAEAVQRYKAGHLATASCPKCNEAIKVTTHVADQRHKYLIISCNCGKCDTTVRLPPP